MAQWSGFEAVHNVADKDSSVKLKVEKNTKSLQFKRWFADSKVVDDNGEPLVERVFGLDPSAVAEDLSQSQGY